MIREVADWEKLGGGLEVPKSKVAQIKQQSSTEGESHQALAEYWVNTDPDASWMWLAMSLYRKGEEKAAAMAKKYLPKGLSTSDLISELSNGCKPFIATTSVVLHVWLLHHSVHECTHCYKKLIMTTMIAVYDT